MARPARLLTDVRFVTIHHSATGLAKNKQDLVSQANAIERYHRDRAVTNNWAAKTGKEFGYEYIQYHYFVAQNGEYLQVQDTKYQRIHAGDYSKGLESHNQHGVAICFIGNFENDIPSEKSLQTAGWLIHELEDKIKKEVKVRGHKDTSIPATLCPGKNLHPKVKAIINYANNPVIPTEPLPTDCEEVRKKLEEFTKANEVMRVSVEQLNVEVGNLKSSLRERDVMISGKSDEVKKLKAEIKKLEKIPATPDTEVITKLEVEAKKREEYIKALEAQNQTNLEKLAQRAKRRTKEEIEASNKPSSYYLALVADLRERLGRAEARCSVSKMGVLDLLREVFSRVFRKS